jgi:histidinol phosphatase-like enzyme (inositol monophosphatase family)
MLDPFLLRPMLEAAINIVDHTDALIRDRYEMDFTHRKKADRSVVTDIDLAVEEYVRNEIARRFPEHGVIGEEMGSSHPDRRLQWVIDPIDGTMSLRHRIPLFGTLLALLDGERPVVGVVSLPMIGERAWAARDLGAFVNGERSRLNDVAEGDIVDEIIAIGERRQFTAVDREAHFDELIRAHPGVRVYCDCFGHMLAFRGSVGAMIDYGLRIWDLAPSRLIIEEAGGVFEIVGEHDGDGATRYDVILGKPTVVRWIKAQLAI